MTFRDLILRLRALAARRRVDRDLDDELAFHVDRAAHEYVRQGMTPHDAHARARRQFGSRELVADQCRDERRTAVVDDTVRDVQYALRTFRRAPLAALTVVGTVGLGLGLVAAVFTFFNAFVFRVDDVIRPDELFAVERPVAGSGQNVSFTRPSYETLRRETSVFSDAFGALHDLDTRIDGRMMNGTLVTGSFFRVLGVNAALGRTLTPADDERFDSRPVVVLSHRGWSRLFSNDATVVGRTLLVNRVPYEIVGVMPDGFRGLSVGPPDYWAPLARLGDFRPIHAGREDQVGIEIVGRLAEGMSTRAAAAGLSQWAARQDPNQRHEIASIVRLSPRRGTIPGIGEAMLAFSPLFFAFGLILLIACANVANMLLARGIARQRELGVRLSLGASRIRVVRQLLTESLLLALTAAALAFAVSRVVLEGTIHAVMTTMAPEVAENVRLRAPDADWRVVVFLVGGAVASTVFFGLAPALRATRVELVRTIRGEITRDARPGRARGVLIGTQVAASALLLICAAVFLVSASASVRADPGMRTDDSVIAEVINEPTRTAMIQAVSLDPLVARVGASAPDALSRPRTAVASTPAASAPVPYRTVSPEYFEILGVDIVRGRPFTPAERTEDSPVVIVSESTARQFWPGGEAIGQPLQLGPDYTPGDAAPGIAAGRTRSLTVVGVARDVAGFRFAGFREAALYLPTNATAAGTTLLLRVNGDPDRARAQLLERLAAVDPNMGQVVTMRRLAGLELYLLQVAFWLTFALGGLALLLTLSGLFSVVSYIVARRTKEMGIRLALGASGRSIARLVVSQSIRPVIVGLAIGAGLAGALATVLMSLPAAAQIGASVRVLDPVAYAGSAIVIVAACVLAALVPARRAARVDPIAALRSE